MSAIEQPQRVAEDMRGKRTTFEEIQVGQELGVIEFTITQGEVDQYCERLSSFHEWYSLGSPFGSTIAPTLMAHRPARRLLNKSFNIRGLFYRWGWELFQPIPVGTKLLLRGWITNKWIKNDREFIEYENECRDDDGGLVFKTTRTYALDFIKRDAPRSVVDHKDDLRLGTGPGASPEPGRPH